MYYTSSPIGEHITLIQSPSGENLYLVTGSRKSALIDANMGVGQLRAFVEALTRNPLMVLLTHGHVDHAPGAAEFEEVYLNSADRELYREHSALEVRQRYLRQNLGDRYEELTAGGFVPPEPDKSFREVTDGQRFDLGGVQIQAVAFPGHTKGSMAFLVEEDRVLITGDACNNFTFLFTPGSSWVEEYLQAVIRVRDKMTGRYDRVLVSHRQPELPVTLLEEMIQVCKKVLEGKSDEVPFTFMGSKALIAKRIDHNLCQQDGRTANLVYRKDHVAK